MGFAPHLSAGLPGTLRVGPLRVPVYGLFATAGMLGALALSQKSARKVGLRAEALWDAGVVGVVAGFVASRVLLIAQNRAVFKAMPMLVLTLPSLTYGGALLAVVAVLVWLRVKQVPVLAALDAWAPCAALLAGCLQLGHFFEGTDAGMPTSLPWGVVAPGDTVLGRTHPVQLYAVAAAAGLGVWWWRMLGRSGRPTHAQSARMNGAPGVVAGRVAAVALMAGGAVSFGLDMLRQPYDSGWGWPVEASQMVAAGAMVVGVVLWGWMGTGGSGTAGVAAAGVGREDRFVAGKSERQDAKDAKLRHEGGGAGTAGVSAAAGAGRGDKGLGTTNMMMGEEL